MTLSRCSSTLTVIFVFGTYLQHIPASMALGVPSGRANAFLITPQFLSRFLVLNAWPNQWPTGYAACYSSIKSSHCSENSRISCSQFCSLKPMHIWVLLGDPPPLCLTQHSDGYLDTVRPGMRRRNTERPVTFGCEPHQEVRWG